MKKLIILSLLAGLNVQSYAGEDRGGGGVICGLSKQCITLAEAGLRIQANASNTQLGTAKAPDAPVISQEVADEVEIILKQLPKTMYGSKWLTPKIVGTSNPKQDVFKTVDLFDTAKFQKVKEDYYRLLRENNFSSKYLDIAAISDDTTTYLLPSFYKLSVRSQALILIHEGVVRRTHAIATDKFNSVQFALEMDGYLVDILNKKQVNMYGVSAWSEKFILMLVYGADDFHKEYNEFLENRFYLNNPVLKFVLSQNKKYKLPKQISISLKERWTIDFTNSYTANAIYKENPEFWNYLKRFDLLGIKSGVDNRGWRGNQPLPFNINTICKDSEDGYYFVGSHIINCQKFKVTSYSEANHLVTSKEYYISPADSIVRVMEDEEK